MLMRDRRMHENSKYAPRARVLLYHTLTSTYHCLRVCPSELVRVVCQHAPHLALHSSLAMHAHSKKLPFVKRVKPTRSLSKLVLLLSFLSINTQKTSKMLNSN